MSKKKIGTPRELLSWLSVLPMDKDGLYTMAVDKGRIEGGTNNQNNFFHELLAEAWKSGVFSDTTYMAFRSRIKVEHGNAKYQIYDFQGQRSIEIQSWSKMNKKQRTSAIQGLINEMMELGATGKVIDSLIREWNACLDGI